MLESLECHSPAYQFWVGVILQVSILVLVVIGITINGLLHKKRK